MEVFVLLLSEKRGSRPLTILRFQPFIRGEHRGIVKSKFILAFGGQWSLLFFDATAAEAQLTNSWISNLGGFCSCPIVNESI